MRDGSQLDESFGGDGVVQTNFSNSRQRHKNHDTLWGAGMDSDDRIVASGHDKSGNLVIARYSTNGELDWSDKPAISLGQSVHAIDFDSTDAAFIAGAENASDEGPLARRFRVIKYLPTGTKDSSFGDNGVFTLDLKDWMAGISPTNPYVDVEVYRSGPHAGKVLLVGTVGNNTVPTREVALMRLNEDGTLDNTFDDDGIVTTNVPFLYPGETEARPDKNYGSGVAIDYSNDRIVVAGVSSHGMNVIRYTSNGSLDASFNPTGAISNIPGVAVVYSPSEVPLPNETPMVTRGRDVVIDDLGRIIVGGRFDVSPISQPDAINQDAFVVARLLENGTVDPEFGVVETVVGGGWNALTDVAIAPDGDIWAAGHACGSAAGCNSYGDGEPFDSVLLRFSSPSAGVTVSPMTIQTSEDGDLAQFDVVLDTQPSGQVSIAVSSSNTNEGQVTSAVNVVFNETNWDVPQSVTIQGMDDTDQDGDQAYDIILDPSSFADSDYNNLESAIVSALNVDNEASSGMHVADLDATTSLGRRGKWNAKVAILVVDAQGNPVTGATVSGTWSGGATGSSTCTTDSNGMCIISRNNIKQQVTSLVFTVTNITHLSLVYDATANDDPDEDSDGTEITVLKP